MVYETRLIFDQLGISRIDRIGEPSILGNRSSIRSDLAKKAPSRANLEDRIEVQATLIDANGELWLLPPLPPLTVAMKLNDSLDFAHASG